MAVERNMAVSPSKIPDGVQSDKFYTFPQEPISEWARSIKGTIDVILGSEYFFSVTKSNGVCTILE